MGDDLGRILFITVATLSAIGIFLAVTALLVLRRCQKVRDAMSGSVSETCDNSLCRDLIPLMVKLVKSELAFEDRDVVHQNEAEVKEHLEKMWREVHGSNQACFLSRRQQGELKKRIF